MTYSQTMEAFEKMLPYVTQISDDDMIKKMYANIREDKEATVTEAFIQLFEPLMIRHKDAMLGIVSVILGKKPQEVEKMPYEEAKAAFHSPLVNDFFTLSVFVVGLAGRL